MNANSMKTLARNTVTDQLGTVLSDLHAIQFDDASWAIRTEVDGQEIWVEIKVQSKAFKATKTYDAFDPETARETWLTEKAEKEAKKKKKEEE